MDILDPNLLSTLVGIGMGVALTVLIYALFAPSTVGLPALREGGAKRRRPGSIRARKVWPPPHTGKRRTRLAVEGVAQPSQPPPGRR